MPGAPNAAQTRLRATIDGKATVAATEPLTPVPTPFPAVLTVARVVSAQALVSFGGNRYSVPPELAGATVSVSVRLGAVHRRCREIGPDASCRHITSHGDFGGRGRVPRQGTYSGHRTDRGGCPQDATGSAGWATGPVQLRASALAWIAQRQDGGYRGAIPWHRDAHVVWELLEASRRLYAALRASAPYLNFDLEAGHIEMADGSRAHVRVSDLVKD